MRNAVLGAAWLAALLVPSLPAQEAAPAPFPKIARFRGFNVPNLNADLLKDARDKFGANSVRYLLPLNWKANVDHVDMAEALRRLVADLPQGLDNARALGLGVVIAMPMYNFAVPGAPAPATPFFKDPAVLAGYLDIWTQIATLCKGRDQEIWLDLMNEPLDRSAMPSGPKEWPGWAQQLIDRIRTIDPVHPVVVEPGPGGLCWGMWSLPLLKGDPVIYSFHQYQPQSYTHQGVADIQHTDLARPFLETGKHWPGEFGDSGGGTWNHDRIVKELEPVTSFLKAHPGARMYVGEFSVVRWAPDGAQYLKDNLEIFERNGWDWSYHAFREHNYWSLERNPDNTEADGFTDRGEVIRDALKRNAGAQP